MRWSLTAIALLIAAPTWAQSYVPSYCAPTAGYAAPSYNYNQYSTGYNYGYNYNYQYPTQKVVAQGVTVAPLLVTVPVDSKAVPVGAYGSSYYYSVGEAYQARNAVRDVIREELKNFAQGPAPTLPVAPVQQPVAPPQPLVQPPIAPETPPPVPQPPAPRAPVPPLPTSALDDITPSELQARVVAVFEGKANCVNCHGTHGKSKFKLVDDQNRLLKQPSDKRWKAFGMASSGTMPPQAATDSSKAISGEPLKALLQWASIK